jgi:hypothetical protein
VGSAARDAGDGENTRAGECRPRARRSRSLGFGLTVLVAAQTRDDDLCWLPTTALLALYQERKVPPVEVFKAQIARAAPVPRASGRRVPARPSGHGIPVCRGSLVFAIVGSLNTNVRVSTKPGQLQMTGLNGL